jgi:hypothetical protein
MVKQVPETEKKLFLLAGVTIPDIRLVEMDKLECDLSRYCHPETLPCL